VNAASQAVRKVRLQRLSLAGFGCYRYATHFELARDSRIFVARNEQGKSTFLRGLLYTLFGVPGGKKRQLFLRRYYNWDRPEEFWGRVEFECNGEQWTVLRDFRRDTVTVTARSPEGERLVLNRHRHRERASESRKDPYDDLLDTWFGIRNRSVYEGIFCIDQRSTVLQRSQIDERVWRYVYGEAAAGLERERRRIYEAFRSLTFCTRDYGVTLAAGGGRNGRIPGRIEQINDELERLRRRRAELETELADLSDPPTAEVEDLRERLAELRAQLALWEKWVSIQGRLLSAVQACSEAERSLGAGAGEGDAHDDGVRALRTLAADGMSTDELRARLEALAERRRLGEEIERLTEQIEELQRQLDGLRQDQEASGDPARLEGMLQELLRLKAIASELERLEQVRAELDLAAADGNLTDEQVHLLQELHAVSAEILELERRREELQGERQSVRQQRGQIEAELGRLEAAQAQARELLRKHELEAEEQHRQACRLREELEVLERQHRERFEILQGAPPGLPMLWDRLHALQQELEQVDRALQQRDLADRLRQSRVRWRRILLVLGVSSTVLTVVLATGWLDLMLAALCGGLTALAARLFPPPSPDHGANAEELRRRRRDLEAENRAILSKLGTRFRPEPDLEARARRLWPEYEHSLAALERLRSELQGAEASEQAVALERDRVVSDLSETIESLEREIEGHRARLRDVDDLDKRLEQEAHAVAQRLLGSIRRLGLDQLQLDSGLSIPVPDQLRFVAEEIVSCDEELRTLEELIRWVAQNGERVRTVLQEHVHRGSEAKRQWQAEVWWSLQNVGLGPEENSQIDQPPDGFDAEAALARLRAEADDLRARLNPLDENADPEELERRLEDAKALASLVAELEGQIDQLRAQRQELQDEVQTPVENEAELSTALERFDGDVEEVVQQFERIIEGARSDRAGEEEIMELRRQARELMAQFPELVAALEQPPEYATQRLEQLRAEVAEVEALLEERGRQAEERQAAAGERRRELDEVSAQIAALEDELRGLEQERDKLAAQFRAVTDRLESLQKECREALEARISTLFAGFSCQPDRRVVLDESMRVMIREPGNHTYVPAHLSHGARDQLCLAVYLALADNLDLPFVFDDPFVNCDDERLAAIRTVWEKLSATRQLILLSHSPQFEGWAEPITIYSDAGQTSQRAAA